jgi:hypothetical protein
MKTVKKNPMYQFLIVLTIASSVGLQAWLILFNNFAVEVAGLQGKHIGMIQSVREIRHYPHQRASALGAVHPLCGARPGSHRHLSLLPRITLDHPNNKLWVPLL